MLPKKKRWIENVLSNSNNLCNEHVRCVSSKTFSPPNINKPIKIDYILCICSHKSLSRWSFSLSEFSEIKIMTSSLARFAPNFYYVIDINIYLLFVLISCKHITTMLLIHSHEFSYTLRLATVKCKI